MRTRTGLVVLLTLVLAAAAACTAGKGGRSGSAGSTPAPGHPATTAAAPAAKASPQDRRSQFEQLLGQHAILAVRLTRGVVSGEPELQQAVTASLRQNTDGLRRLVAAAYGATEGDRFGQVWQRHVDDLLTYASAVARDDGAAKERARSALEADSADHGSWFAEASSGRIGASDAAAGMRADVEDLVAQVDAYAAHDYGTAYRIERKVYEHMFAAGVTFSKGSVSAQLAAKLDAPPEKLRSAFAMLLGEHMELIVDAERAAFQGPTEFRSAAAQINANSSTITQAIGAIVGPRKGAEFQTAWANHVEALMAYTAAVAGKDQAERVAAEKNLDAFASRLALYFSGIVRYELPVEPLTAAITMHDTHLIGQINAYASKNYREAQEMELHGYQQMLGVADTLVGAIQRTVKSGLPVGGAQTGGGGTAQRGR
jgi:hypothetical protein